MTPDDAKDEFLTRLRDAHPEAMSSFAFGASNAPFVLDGGFRFGLYNIDSIDYDGLHEAGNPLILVTRIVLPPRNILHLALLFDGGGLQAVQARRNVIAAAAKDQKANKVRFYLHRQGIYLAQADFPSIKDPSDEMGMPLSATVGYFADVEHEGELNAVETEYVRYLGSLLGGTPLKRLGPQGSTLGGAAVTPATADFNKLYERIIALGAYYERPLVERYHVALNHLGQKHFALLTGISGTGKTLLAKAYAYSVLGISALNLPAENFHLIAVRPDWTEPAHLLGYVDAVSQTYQRTRFIDALLQAHRNPARPVFVCLDEMNLAQPEHYFADVLSAMETGESIHLHREGQDIGVPQSIPWPDNLYIIGTVNMDETTRPFSPKVLDRANAIDMSEVDIPGYCATLAAKSPELADVLDAALVQFLKRLSDILAPHRLHFGYRTVEEISRYVAYSRTQALLPDALDVQVTQKVLTKLRGGPEHESMLADLGVALDDLPHSMATVKRMRDELSLYESFQFWR
ncbi:hypothetical protein OV208_03685 [Corallococcus sp. bb12-1]|uniref:McrB family protein n=1 Tax=Corallococcus sp. bb12-1 TaxID=2996784 RepID=UPI00226F9860|nr:hypothetical protein [Corallococcus sp. bb12-1]MCY1040412.1 hypothetical protein [Corallococcus sp. bb12-1]